MCRIIEKAQLAVLDLDLGGRSGKEEGGYRLLSGPGEVCDPAAGKVHVARGMVFPDTETPLVPIDKTPSPSIVAHK
ncbi:hypothetical protein BOX30_03075 [Leptospirillum ferriphilum]|nr:hypothetical protein BOX30_03075 [Leptospirillum ferriphilum]